MPESVNSTVKLYDPLVVGVPEMTPVEALSESPGGREPEEIDHVYDGVPPLEAKVREYLAPTWPVGSELVVIVSGSACTVRVVLPVTLPRVAEMVVGPAVNPVARPAAVMVATPVFEEAHATWVVMFCVLPFE